MHPRIPTTAIDATDESVADMLSRPDPEDGLIAEGFVARDESEQMRAEKLAAIRKAVDSGAYDAPQILDEALKVLLRRLESDEPGHDHVRAGEGISGPSDESP